MCAYLQYKKTWKICAKQNQTQDSFEFLENEIVVFVRVFVWIESKIEIEIKNIHTETGL